jgi:steroid 5-alpha reductase family enzyme
MKKTVFFLLVTLFILPLCAIYFGTPPNEIQWNIIKNAYYIVAGVILYTFIVGQLTGNYSQVDKLWSIVPIIYVWFMAYMGQWNDRMVLMSVLVTLWGIRLTYNFARRGAYTWRFWEGEEDYRWEILRKKPGLNKPFVWMLFNLGFICFYQNSLIFLITLPVIAVYIENVAPLGMVDYFLALLFVVVVIIEYMADQQQFDYQTEKYKRLNAGKDLGIYEDGFVSKGLWGIVRHPKYAAEQSIWIILYFFSVVATGQWFNWSIGGAILLLLLFRGSADFSEEISAFKYPKYLEYQEKVPRFIPNIFRRK